MIGMESRRPSQKGMENELGVQKDGLSDETISITIAEEVQTDLLELKKEILRFHDFADTGQEEWEVHAMSQGFC